MLLKDIKTGENRALLVCTKKVETSNDQLAIVYDAKGNEIGYLIEARLDVKIDCPATVTLKFFCNIVSEEELKQIQEANK